MSSGPRNVRGDLAHKISPSETNEPVPQETETVEGLKSNLRSQQLSYAESFEQLAYALTHDMSELLRMVRSYIALQSHHSEVWFRNIRIRRL